MKPWNHNIHYHKLIIKSIPFQCKLALDVGCGQGFLTRQLAELCEETIGIDIDNAVLPVDLCIKYNIKFVHGDIILYPFEKNSFDLIASVATLHHLPLDDALERFRDLLKPGGVLIVIGLYRLNNIGDHIYAVGGILMSNVINIFKRPVDVKATFSEPKEQLDQIRATVAKLLPGAVVKRRMLFRYSLIWKKPL